MHLLNENELTHMLTTWGSI